MLKQLCGVGLRQPHYDYFLKTPPDLSWLEVHPENFGDFFNQQKLLKIREKYEISLHSVGLSLGTAAPVDLAHLAFVKNLSDQLSPFLVSDHVSWSRDQDVFLNDLLPLPYTEESLENIVRNIQQVQEALQRQILVENPSSYMAFEHSTIPEWEFMREIAARADCLLLLDVNNVYVSAMNHNFDPQNYIDHIPGDKVREIHLAGHSFMHFEGGRTIRVDDHGSRVSDAVWDLYAYTLDRIGCRPSLIEWDTNIPAPTVLLEEAAKAELILAQHKTGDTYADAC